jgi:IS30 family transposase
LHIFVVKAHGTCSNSKEEWDKVWDTFLSQLQTFKISETFSVMKEIAQQIGVHPSTICREFWRNTDRRGPTAGCYSARNTQRKTTERHTHKPKALKFNDRMKQVAVQWLQVDKWSPELISVRSKETGLCPVSHECLYQWIWACKHGNKRVHQPFKRLYQDLRHGHRRRKRGLRRDSRGVITGRVSIEKRPAIVQSRKRVGDIEVDLMMCKNHQGALLVMTDRATLHTHLHKLPNKKSHSVSKSIGRILHKATYPLHTLTFDNDKAFAEHQAIGLALGLEP